MVILQHYLVAREHRKEKKARKSKVEEVSEPPIQGDVVEENNEDRGLLISYCSLDYQRIFDMARLRLYKMRQALKSELDDRYSPSH